MAVRDSILRCRAVVAAGGGQNGTGDDSGQCPSRDVLLGFSQGRLEAWEIEEVGRHIGQCPRCEATLEALDGLVDKLQSRLRHASVAGTLLEEPEFHNLVRRAQELAAEDIPSAELPPVAGSVPEKVGRYVIEREIGAGSFSRVYLARDPALDRRVAVKVARSDKVPSPRQFDSFLREARAVASLKHPRIVPVYDVGRDSDGTPYFVMEYVEGSSLAEVLRSRRLPIRRCVQLVLEISGTVQHAHKCGFVHRDLKPANILLDTQGRTYVTDLGLAFHETDESSESSRMAGSPAYMAPEQVRGENHRVDARSDIWALGVMLYELLAGKRPFRAKNYGHLFEEIEGIDPLPLSQINEAIPPELDRICQRCMAKHMVERYGSVAELLEELAAWEAGGDEDGTASDGQGIPLVPKGLRAFGAEDADFFLELLPGPRDRVGMPQVIRFWKNRIENGEDGRACSVGVVYGPSGCGKSSMIRAGLLPRLDDRVIPIYVQATVSQTEEDSLAALQRCCRGIPASCTLPEAVSLLRRSDILRPSNRVVIVLDQFEQWLHAHPNPDASKSELVRSLRQCDARVQCLLVVRDEFWMPLARLMRQLEIPIVEGENTAAVDLLDCRHARRVLCMLGRAYGRLPSEEGAVTKTQRQFVDKAVEMLAENGSVVCVRLAMFVETVKRDEWTPRLLKRVRCAGGVGSAFLETHFRSGTCAAEYRRHRSAAQAVLKSLLPEQGAEIKGHCRSRRELRHASGYVGLGEDFRQLMRVLDQELHLITPVFSSGKEDAELADEDTCQYQLTHDFLVGAIREWLSIQQQATCRGRAQLRLEARSRLWHARPEPRQLPAWWEWLSIRLWTRRRGRRSSEQRMLAAADRHHVIRGMIFVLVLGCLLWAGVGWYVRFRADHLHELLLDANIRDLPRVVGQVEGRRRWVEPLIVESLKAPDLEPRKELNLRLGLGRDSAEQTQFFLGRILVCDPEEASVICSLIGQWQCEGAGPAWADLERRLWESLEDSGTPDRGRLRAAVALAGLDRRNDRFREHGSEIVDWLLSEPPMTISGWIQMLVPIRNCLTTPLEARLKQGLGESRHTFGIMALAEFYRDDVARLASLTTYTRSHEIPLVVGYLDSHRHSALKVLSEKLGRVQVDFEQGGSNERERPAQIVAEQTGAVALTVGRLGQPDVLWPLLRNGRDPRVRTFLIHQTAAAGIDARILLERVRVEPIASVRSALIVALGEYDKNVLLQNENHEPVDLLVDLYCNDPDPGVHSAAQWVLRSWGSATRLEAARQSLVSSAPENERSWYVNRSGFCMAVMAPAEYWMGTQPNQGGAVGESLVRHRRRVSRTVAISTAPVTLRQFLEIIPSHENQHDFQVGPDSQCAANNMSHARAMEYCLKLSEREGIPPDQWCYEYVEVNGRHEIVPPEDMLSRTGYRLPTEAEWEMACRAGTETRCHFGSDVDLVTQYAWCLENSQGHTWPVGLLRPNAFGLFDVYGNLFELCQDTDYSIAATDEVIEDELQYEQGKNVVAKGAAYRGSREGIRSSWRTRFSADASPYRGFRIARTLVP